MDRLRFVVEPLKPVLMNYSVWFDTMGPRREKICLRGFTINKGADQPAHPRSLISALVKIAYWKVSYQDLLREKFQFSS